jgi:ketosteroid isomerase-like protein
MSQEGLDEGGVRTTIVTPAETNRRTLDERLFVKFPVLVRTIGSAYLRLPPGSRLRRALTVRNALRTAVAFNRRDFDVVLHLLDPMVEFEAPESPIGGFLPPDMPRVHHGRGGYMQMLRGLLDVWYDLQLAPDEVIDFGDRVLVGGRITGHGRKSGIVLDAAIFQLVTLRGGLIVRQRDFAHRSAALEAAGLSE